MRNKYLDLARKLKPKEYEGEGVIGALCEIPKRLLKCLEDIEIRGRVETTALLKSARILIRVLETWGDLLSLNIQWEIIS